MTERSYEGDELELFASAVHWKGYCRKMLNPFIGGDVLEVGAGLGGTTRILCDGSQRSWLSLEPDPSLFVRLERLMKEGSLPSYCRAMKGIVADLDSEERFDSMLYIDVLEHIEDDAGELQSACDHLRDKGFLLILVPAFQSLFSPFDRAIGHFRRYDRTSLLRAVPPSMKLRRLKYLDALGAFISFMNRVFMRQASPSPLQIKVWDSIIVPASVVADCLCNYTFGRSLIGIWQKD